MGQPTQGSTLRRVADVIDAAEQSLAVPGRLAAPVLTALAALVPCDSVTFLDFAPEERTTFAMDEAMSGEVTYSTEAVTEAADDPFFRHYPMSQFCSYPTRTRDDRSVTLRSDFYSTREWQQTPMYVDVMRGDGVLYELMCPLPNQGARTRRLVFARTGAAADFTEEDRFAMALLRPHLVEMASRRSDARAAELTERQRELMLLVAAGRTNAEIAAELHLSPHTVRTHLANIFERLGVTTRTAAVSRVYST